AEAAIGAAASIVPRTIRILRFIARLVSDEYSASGGGFHLRVEIGDDVLERRDRLLHGGDLHQFPAVDRAVTLLQGHHEVAPVLLKLHQRQAMVGKRSYHRISRAFSWTGLV